MISHGTLLVNSNLSFMQSAIESPLEINIKSKASPSVRSKVKNLAELLQNNEFNAKNLLHDFLSIDEEFKVDSKLIDTNYLSSECWIYNRSPKFVFENNTHIFEVEKGIIVSLKNKKGLLIKNSPLVNSKFKDFIVQ